MKTTVMADAPAFAAEGTAQAPPIRWEDRHNGPGASMTVSVTVMGDRRGDRGDPGGRRFRFPRRAGCRRRRWEALRSCGGGS